MNPTSLNEQQHHILFDSNAVGEIVPQWFEIEYWQDLAQVTATGRGRGRAWFVESKGRSMVLRHYQRGGAMSGLLGDRYFWQGLENTRAWREWHLLATLWQQGLPVPQPLAAHVIHTGLFYRADLLTVKIPASRSLSDYLLERSLQPTDWQSIGQLLRRFHDAKIFHADLNAHNILMKDNLEFYLIDFDKGKIMAKTQNEAWKEANLQRLRRSLQKLSMIDNGFHYTDADWTSLLTGYAK